TDWSVTLIKSYLRPDGCVVSLQNGMNDERVAALVGYGRTVGCTVFTGSALVEPGHIVTRDYAGFVAFKVGELHGRITPRAREIAALLSHAAEAEPITNIWGERWSKLVTNCMGNPLSGIGGAEGGNSFASEAGLRLTVAVTAEAIRVGEALGFAIEPVRGLPVEVWKAAADGIELDELRKRFGTPEPRL